MANVDGRELETRWPADMLSDELLAVVGDNEDLRRAAMWVGSWAASRMMNFPRAISNVRHGLVAGFARELDCLRADADVLEHQAAALRLLIAHAEATRPTARRRRGPRDRRSELNMSSTTDTANVQRAGRLGRSHT